MMVSRLRRTLGGRPIVLRLVLAVAVAMSVVLILGGALVYWRVYAALDQQVNRDLANYSEVVEQAVRNGNTLVRDTPGFSYQVYDMRGDVIGGNDHRRLVTRAVLADVIEHGTQRGDVGALFPPDRRPYRYVAEKTPGPHGPVLAAIEISRAHRDEALRELLLQLVIFGGVTLIAASVVGYWTARGALDPVERYRRVAASAGESDRLPVPATDDELSRLGHTFNQLLDRIAQSSARERQFLADASHELRGPLTVMRTEVEWAMLQAPAGERETLQSLGSQVDRMVNLCNALLELEELRAQPGVSNDPVDLAALADEVVERWRSRFDQRGRVLAHDVPPGLLARGNHHWVDLAVDNLVSNALRYGKGDVVVGARREGSSAVALWVTDEGPGFPDGFAEKAFDRFSRADEARTAGGIGLGLALVAAVAEAHAGSVGIEGARVTLTLPRLG